MLRCVQAKNDLAQDLCRKTLLENKSCSQAWEILGLVFEKEGNYELASDAYAKVSSNGQCCSVVAAAGSVLIPQYLSTFANCCRHGN